MQQLRSFLPAPRAFSFQPNRPIYYNFNPYLNNYVPTQYQQILPGAIQPPLPSPPVHQQPAEFDFGTSSNEPKPKKSPSNPKRKLKPHSRAEPTTARPAHAPETITVIPEKFVSGAQRSQDIRVYNAQQRPDRTFKLQQIYPVTPAVKTTKQSAQIIDDADEDVPTVSVSAHTSADAPNDLDFGEGAFALGPNPKGGATLLLQPSAKAISGNFGQSISAPVSRAVLRKNSGTRVIFRPDSVAIAGAGGTAHAQADLILDYVE